MRILPILFNTEMVRAIEEGRKSQTRRIIRLKYENSVLEMKTDKYGTRLIEIMKDEEGVTFGRNEDGSTWRKIRPYIEPQPAYKRGDILYVRETWNYGTVDSDYKEYELPECWFEEEDWRNDGKYKFEICRFWYKANAEDEEDMEKLGGRWRPSIHMPKEAARIWLRVTGVKCQRIQNITVDDARAEGIVVDEYSNEAGETFHTDNDGNTWEAEMSEEADTLLAFQTLWDSTVQKTELEEYGWNANPWVWVYHFERCEKP